MARHPDKEMMKSWKHFDTSVKLCKQAHTANKVARYKNLLATLETTFYKFEEDFEFYKEDTIKKTCRTEDAFNASVSEDGVERAAFTNNDAWSDLQMTRYVDTRDLLQDILDDADSWSKVTQVTTKESVDLLVEDFKADCVIVESSITKLKDEIEGYEDHSMAINSVISYENIVLKLKAKIAEEIRGKVSSKIALADDAKDAEFTNDKLIAKFGAFSKKQNTELDCCSMLLVRKSIAKEEKEAKPYVDSGSTSGVTRPREQVFLEKTRPPRFNGDDLDFPEFSHKSVKPIFLKRQTLTS